MISDEYVSKSSISMDDRQHILTISGKDGNRHIKDKNKIH